MSADLFPLPLTPLEYYYWCDDCPEYPTTFPAELVFSPGLRRGEFERALAVVVARHPLLTSLVAEDGRRGPCWIGGSPPVPVDWAGQETPMNYAGGDWIDLRRMPGLRISARGGDDSTRLWLQFHHACCDGLGAMRVIEELMIAYAGLCGGPVAAPPLPPLEPVRLCDRAKLGMPSRSAWEVMSRLVRGRRDLGQVRLANAGRPGRSKRGRS